MMVHAVLMHISDLRIQRWVLKSFIVLTATAQTSGHMSLYVQRRRWERMNTSRINNASTLMRRCMPAGHFNGIPWEIMNTRGNHHSTLNGFQLIVK